MAALVTSFKAPSGAPEKHPSRVNSSCAARTRSGLSTAGGTTLPGGCNSAEGPDGGSGATGGDRGNGDPGGARGGDGTGVGDAGGISASAKRSSARAALE